MAKKAASSDSGAPAATASRLSLTVSGHSHAEAEFLAAWNSGRVHHAWLITGPRGIGKASLAYRIARFVLAGGQGEPGLFGPEMPQTLHIAPDDQATRLIAQAAHPDLRVIERGWDEKRKKRRGEIVVEDVRDLGAFLAMTASLGGWRVVIVDAADEMNRNAANALLKNLEEPPTKTVVLMVAHAPARLLPTIRSRCRTLALKPLSAENMIGLLTDGEKAVPVEVARSLALLAEGSLGRAWELADNGGVALYEQLIALLRGLPKLDGAVLYDFIDHASKDDDSFDLALEMLSGWLAHTIAGGGRGQLPAEVIPGENGLRRILLAAAPLARWVEVWDKITRLAERTGAINLDKKQVLVVIFLSLERVARGLAP